MLQLADGSDEEHTVNIVKSLYVHISNYVAKCYIKFLLLKCHKIEIQDEINIKSRNINYSYIHV